jgi:hypothetical protein
MISYLLTLIALCLNLAAYYIHYQLKRCIDNENKLIARLDNRIKRLQMSNIPPGSQQNLMSLRVIAEYSTQNSNKNKQNN